MKWTGFALGPGARGRRRTNGIVNGINIKLEMAVEDPEIEKKNNPKISDRDTTNHSISQHFAGMLCHACVLH